MKERKKIKTKSSKTNITLKSAIIGTLGIGAMIAPMSTVYGLENSDTKQINIRYVTKDQLTKAQLNQLQPARTPTIVTADYDTYYMVYQVNDNKTLPKTGSVANDSILMISGGILLIGLAFIKERRKKVITSIIFLTVLGAVPLEVFALEDLRSYDQTLTLKVGEEFPNIQVDINGYKFLGYLPMQLAFDKTKLLNNSDGIGTQTSTEEVIPYEIQYIDDETLLQGQEQVVQEGQEGILRKDYEDGKLVGESIVQEVLAKIIRRGIRVESIVDMPFNRIEQEDETLYEGETKVLQSGQLGKKKQIFVKNQLVDEQVLQEPLDEKVAIGTKKKEMDTKEDSDKETEYKTPDNVDKAVNISVAMMEPIPFETKIEEDENFLVGTREVIQQGVFGRQKIIKTPKGKKNIVEIAPVDEIVRIGVKSEENVTVPFETEYIQDATLAKGEQRIIQEGKQGIAKKIFLRGVLSETIELTSPVNQKIAIGIGTQTSTEEVIPYEIQYIDDETLLQGQEQVVQEGQEGILRKDYEDGKLVGESIVQEALAKIIHRGIQVESIVDMPFNRIEQEDETLYEGETKVLQSGQLGKKKQIFVKNQLVDEQVLQEPLDEKVAIGTKKKEMDTKEDSDKETEDKTPDTKEVGDKEAEDKRLDTKEVSDKETEDKTPDTKEAGDKEAEDEEPYNKETNIQEPTLTLNEMRKNADNKTVTVSFVLDNPYNNYQGATVALYRGEQLIEEKKVADLTSVTLSLPNYEELYHIEPCFTYLDEKNKLQTKRLLKNPVELSIKKIEIKDVEKVSLFKKENNQYLMVRSLDAIPTDFENYYVRIYSKKMRDMLLPVSEMSQKDAYTINVHSDLSELVQDKDLSPNSEYVNGFTFELPKRQSQENIYFRFDELIAAMKSNRNGEFIIGSNMDATGYTVNDVAYVEGEFTGKLTGKCQGQQYYISNLAAPLFKEIKDAEMKNLQFINVQINNSATSMGTLASTINHSVVKDVLITGSLKTQRNVGSLAYLVADSLIENVAFKGTITTTTIDDNNIVGGIVGALARSTLKDSYVDATLDASSSKSNLKIGGAVGFTNGTSEKDSSKANIFKAFTRGKLNTSIMNDVGGIVGSTQGSEKSSAGVVQTVVNQMDIPLGNEVFGYTAGVKREDMKDAYTTTYSQPMVTSISDEEAQEKLKTFQSYHLLRDVIISKDEFPIEIDYLQLASAKADRAIAYENTEKLLPFYNKEIIIKYGNRIADNQKLKNTRLLSVTPMMNQSVVSDLYKNKAKVNRLLLNYEDGQIEYLTLTYLGDYKNTAISEYQIIGTDLIYTPEHFLADYEPIIVAVKEDLQALNYHSNEVYQAFSFGTTMSEEEKVRKLDELYLEDVFNDVKTNIDQQLRQVLTTDKSINISKGVIQDSIIDYIKTNKAKLLLGLAYMQRWYNINFGEMNIQNLATFYQDFYGKPVNTMEWLISLVNAGYDRLVMANHLNTFTQYIAKNTGKSNLFDYLTDNRQKFTNEIDDSSWFKKATKAYIVEGRSKEVPDHEVRAYERMKNSNSEKNGILPLLTADEGIFVITTMTTITYGMFDRYMDMNLKLTDPASYQQEVLKVKTNVDKEAKRQVTLMDSWYRLVPENIKPRLFRTIPVWDGYMVRNKWLGQKYGAFANQAIKDFFGPVGSRSNITNNGSAAYANGTSIFYVWHRVLDDIGHRTLTHEMTHNSDSNTYLLGYGRRNGMGGETYAKGMFEAGLYDAGILNLNLTFDYTNQKESLTRYTNVSAERFQTLADLKEYAHGMLDMMYVLDYAEAQAVLKQDENVKMQWYGVLENKYDNETKKGHAVDKVRLLTEEEAKGLNKWQDLFSNNIVSLKEYNVGATYNRNGYYPISLFNADYSALNNPYGSPGGRTLRRRAYELLADQGYQEGFVPYVSNQLNTKQQPVTDQVIFDEILASQYQDWTDFKTKKMQERIDRLSHLASVQFEYFKQQYNVQNFEEIQKLMDEAVANDIKNGKIRTAGRGSYVHLLKMTIYNAFLRQTNDFKSSIFNDFR